MAENDTPKVNQRANFETLNIPTPISLYPLSPPWFISWSDKFSPGWCCTVQLITVWLWSYHSRTLLLELPEQSAEDHRSFHILIALISERCSLDPGPSSLLLLKLTFKLSNRITSWRKRSRYDDTFCIQAQLLGKFVQRSGCLSQNIQQNLIFSASKSLKTSEKGSFSKWQRCIGEIYDLVIREQG